MKTRLMILLAALVVLAGALAVRGEEAAVSADALFLKNCSTCHGPEGRGDGATAPALVPRPADLTHRPFKYGCNPNAVFRTLTQGVEGTAMPGFAESLDDAERWALARYVSLLSGSPGGAGPCGGQRMGAGSGCGGCRRGR